MKEKHKKHTNHNPEIDEATLHGEAHGGESAGVSDSEISSPPAADSADAVTVESPEALKVEVSKPENDDKYLRLMADFDNFRKRTIRERLELYQRANEDIIEEILPVLDHVDLALNSAVEHKTDSAVVGGFRLVAEQLMSAMKKSGLSPIDVVEKAAFDPSIHEAISHLPSDTVPENAVIAQVRRGYMLGGRMLRATQVVVSSGIQTLENPAKSQPEDSIGGE